MGDKTKNLKRENDTLKTQLRELSEEVNTLREMVEKKIPQDSTDKIQRDPAVKEHTIPQR